MNFLLCGIVVMKTPPVEHGLQNGEYSVSNKVGIVTVAYDMNRYASCDCLCICARVDVCQRCVPSRDHSSRTHAYACSPTTVALPEDCIVTPGIRECQHGIVARRSR